jgi:uncharacterized membrane protein YdjX (TVP38/TMEM64 family)
MCFIEREYKLDMHLKDNMIHLFSAHQHVALLVSVIINIVISVMGVVPNVFLTAANLAVFGFWEGTVISIIGEAFGAVIAFLLYRRGFRKAANMKWCSHPKAKKLLAAKGKKSFFLILTLRLFPFIPSGIVTFIAAIGQTTLLIFLFSSSIGKIPAILMEAYSFTQIMNWTAEGKILSILFAVLLLIITWKRL